MIHGGEIYDKRIELDFSVSLNPYPCPEKVLRAIKDSAAKVTQYPDLSQKSFREKVARAENKLLGQDLITYENVLGGNGASELIMAIIRLVNPGKVLLPIPSFYGYIHAIKSCSNIEVASYQLSEEKNYELGEDFPDQIDDTTDLVILGNPNNPTGKLISEELLEKIIRKCSETRTPLLIDECFLRLSSTPVSAAKYLTPGASQVPELFIVNAYTKLFSIPGVRVGYALASRERIEELKALLPEWNMSVFALSAGEACAEVIAESDYVERSRAFIEDQKRAMTKDLNAFGLKVFPSDTNFILVKSDKNLYDFFLERGILIRDCRTFDGLNEGFYRIAVKDMASYERMKECFSFLT